MNFNKLVKRENVEFLEINLFMLIFPLPFKKLFSSMKYVVKYSFIRKDWFNVSNHKS